MHLLMNAIGTRCNWTELIPCSKYVLLLRNGHPDYQWGWPGMDPVPEPSQQLRQQPGLHLANHCSRGKVFSIVCNCLAVFFVRLHQFQLVVAVFYHMLRSVTEKRNLKKNHLCRLRLKVIWITQTEFCDWKWALACFWYAISECYNHVLS